MKHGHGKHQESRGKDRDERGGGDFERQQRQWARDNERGPSRDQYSSQGYDHEPRDSRDHWGSSPDSRQRGDFYGSARDSRYGYDQGNGFSSADRQHRDEPNRGHHDHHFDPDYLQWRDEQMRMLDRDYLAWRKDRYQKFSQEFNQWREGNRQHGGEQTPLGASLKATDEAAQGRGDQASPDTTST